MVAPVTGDGLLSAGSSIVGGILGSSSARKAEKRAYARQKQIMQNQIQWKMADAKKAGIHPLVAMGHNMVSGSQSIAGSGHMGSAVADAGAAIVSGRQRARSEQRQNRVADAEVARMEAEALEAQARAKYYGDIVSNQSAGSQVHRYIEAINKGGTSEPNNQIKPHDLSVIAGKDKNNVTDVGASFNLWDALINPSKYNAEMVEQEKGEPASWLYSVSETLSDTNEKLSAWERKMLNKVRSFLSKKRKNQNPRGRN